MLEAKIKGKIERFDGEKAIISSEIGEVSWPKDRLNPQCTEGDAIYLLLLTEKENQASEEELARSVLNEVLRGE